MSREHARQGWVKLLDDPDPVKAELLLGRLQSSGIEAVLEAVPLSMLHVSVGRFASSYRLWVRHEQEDEARQLLQERFPQRELEQEATEAQPGPGDEPTGDEVSKK